MDEFIVHLKEETGSTHLLGLTSKYIDDTIANDKYIYDFSLYCKYDACTSWTVDDHC